MEFGLLEVALGLAALLLLYHYITSGLDYWSKKGVAGPRPFPIAGNFASVFLNKKAAFQVCADMYNTYRKYPFVGAFRGRQPIIIATDLDLIRNILIKDFSIFAGRGLPTDEKNEPLTSNLFALDGPRWKELRRKLTPFFTSGKIKHMFELICECADHFEKNLKVRIGEGKVIECKDVIARFTTDVIGSCAFGLDMSAMDDEDSEFRKMGKKIFEPSFKMTVVRLVRQMSPGLAKVINLRFLDQSVENFFISLINDTMAMRERENISRHDLVDTLISIKNHDDNNEFKFTIGNLAAQAFIFFAAGFETSSTTISFALLELAHAPEYQEKLRDEILEAIRKCNGKITYEVVSEMKYLDMVVKETLRKNPPVTLIFRKAYAPYQIPDSDIIIEEGMPILIPTYAIHHDPEYYSEPEVFDPERFSDEAKHSRHPMTYLPFGDGPKNCIGERFALYQTKMGIIQILKNYRLKPTELSPMPYEIDISSLVLATTHGVHLKFEPLR